MSDFSENLWNHHLLLFYFSCMPLTLGINLLFPVYVQIAYIVFLTYHWSLVRGSDVRNIFWTFIFRPSWYYIYIDCVHWLLFTYDHKNELKHCYLFIIFNGSVVWWKHYLLIFYTKKKQQHVITFDRWKHYLLIFYKKKQTNKKKNKKKTTTCNYIWSDSNFI